MIGCSPAVVLLAVIGSACLIGSAMFLVVFALAGREDDERGEIIPAAIRDRLGAWWDRLDLGWAAFAVFAIAVGGVILWIALDAVNRSGIFEAGR